MAREVKKKKKTRHSEVCAQRMEKHPKRGKELRQAQ